MVYSNYSSAEARIFLDIINKVRAQNFYPPWDWTEYVIAADTIGQFGQKNYINEIQFVFEGPGVYDQFRRLRLKDASIFTLYDNQLFGTVINDFRVSNDLEPYVYTTTTTQISETFLFYAQELTAPPGPARSYTTEENLLWFDILNTERAKLGYDPVLVPISEPDGVRWFWDVKVKELPEFNTAEQAKLLREIKVWAIAFLMTGQREGYSFNEVEVLGVFTNEDDALLAFASLQDTAPENTEFFITELLINKEIELYLPIPFEQWPDWLKELRS